MYNPARFNYTDKNEIFELMDHYPFATLVSVKDGEPFVSHVPLTPKLEGEKIELIGHLARANPHWRLLKDCRTKILFNGPHAYITPKWYAKNDVPTWNYEAVHVTGKIELVEDYDGLVACLKELTNHVERHWPSGWEFFVPEDLGKRLAGSIVGFRVQVEDISFKKKLSQNKTGADRDGIFRGLEARGDDNSRAVLAEMRKLFV